jgi:hypothetical protein
LPLDIKASPKEDMRLFAFWMKGGIWLLDKGSLFDVRGFGKEKNC